MAQHSFTRTKNFSSRTRSKFSLHPREKQCGFLHPPHKCGYLQPARVNPPRAGLQCMLTRRGVRNFASQKFRLAPGIEPANRIVIISADLIAVLSSIDEHGQDWIRTEANFGRSRTGLDCNFFQNWRIRSGSD